MEGVDLKSLALDAGEGFMLALRVEHLALLAAGAFMLALPVEYLCRRKGWGVPIRPFAWAIGVVSVWALLMRNAPLSLGASFEEKCWWSAHATAEMHCLVVKPIIIGGLSLVLWSVLYVVATAVCRSIYRHALA